MSHPLHRHTCGTVARAVSGYIEKAYPKTVDGIAYPGMKDGGHSVDKMQAMFGLSADAIPTFRQFVEWLAVTPDSDAMDHHYVSQDFRCGTSAARYTNLLHLEKIDDPSEGLGSLLERIGWPTTLSADSHAAKLTWQAVKQLNNASSTEYAPPRYESLLHQLGVTALNNANSSDALVCALLGTGNQSEPKLNLTDMIAKRFAFDLCPGGGECYRPPAACR